MILFYSSNITMKILSKLQIAFVIKIHCYNINEEYYYPTMLKLLALVNSN